MASASSDMSEFSDKTHVLVFSNKLLQFQIKYNDKSRFYALLCNAYVVNVTERRLQEIENYIENNGRLCYATSAAILDCNLVIIGESKLQIPVVLIGREYTDSNHQKVQKLILVTLTPGERDRMALAYYGVPIKITHTSHGTSKLNVTLTDGPMICWLKSPKLFVNYLMTTNGRFVIMNTTLPDVISPSILALSPKYEQTSPTTLIGSLRLIVRSDSSSSITTIRFNPYENSISIVSTTELKRSSHEKYLTCAKLVSFIEDHEPERFLCSTSNGDLVEFDFGGSVTNINSTIGFTAEKMLLYRGKWSSGRYVILQYRSKSSVIDLNSFEVIKTYNDITDVYVGDFLRFGTSSHILMVTRHPGKDLDRCHMQITDLIRDFFASKGTAVCTNQSFGAVTKALESRSIAGREAVSKNASRLEHLDQVLTNVCYTLREFAIGHESKRDEQTTHLFELLDSKSKSLPIVGTQTLIRDECCEPLDVGQPWQRIVNDRWIIGVEIANLSNGTFSDLHLVLASDQSELSHSTNIFLLKPYSSLVEDAMIPPRSALKKKFKAGDLASETENVLKKAERVVLTAALDIGVLKHKPKLSINIVVTFKSRVQNKITSGYVTCPSILLSADSLLNDNFLTNFEAGAISWATSFVTINGNVTPSFPNQFSPFTSSANGLPFVRSFTIAFPYFFCSGMSELLCSLAAAQATTKAIKVTLVSEHTDMTSLDDILKQSSDFSYVQRLSVFHWDKAERKVLSGLLFDIIYVENKSRAHMMTYSKNQSQFFAFVNYLYDVMPDDILVLPYSNDVPQPTVTSSLLQEVDFITKFLDREAGTARKQKERALPALQTVDEIRRDFERQASRDEDVKRIQIVNDQNYTRFRDDLFQLEMKTDRLIASELISKNS